MLGRHPGAKPVEILGVDGLIERHDDVFLGLRHR